MKMLLAVPALVVLAPEVVRGDSLALWLVGICVMVGVVERMYATTLRFLATRQREQFRSQASNDLIHIADGNLNGDLAQCIAAVYAGEKHEGTEANLSSMSGAASS